MIAKPDASEHAAYFSRYIDLVPEGDVLGALRMQIEGTLGELRSFSAAESLRSYAEGKWSLREVVVHLSDTERIFSYRALRFARGDRTPLAGFDQGEYILPGGFDALDWGGLIDEFGAVRRSSLFLFEGLDAAAWARSGIASGHEISVRAIAYILAGHERHHLRIIREQYRLA